MKRIITLLGIGLMSFYGQSQTLDQSNTASTGSGWLVNSGPYESVAQSFTPGLSDDLVEVVISLDADNGSYPIIAGDFTISILNGNGYGGSVVGTETFTITGTEVSGDYSIPITSTINLVSGNSYTYIIDEISGTGQIMLNASSNTYTGGDLYYNTGSPGIDQNRDFKFKTYMSYMSCSITDQTINTADFSAICSTDTTIEIASSENNIYYFLRDNSDNSNIGSPVTGNGSAINFPTGNVSSSTTYNVFASGESNALSFNGTNQNAYISTPTGLPSGGIMTVEAWVKPNSYPDSDFNGVVSWGARNCSPAGQSFILSMSNTGRPSFAGWCNDFVPNTGPSANLNEWNHIAAVINGSTVKLYLNGYEWISTLSAPQNVTGGYLFIGATDSNGGRSFDGQIDEVRIWNTERTKNEIISNSGTCLAGTETGLTNYFQMEEGSGSTISDMVNSNVLAIVNSPWVSGAPVCSSCNLQLSTTPTITVNPIADQTVAITDTTLCMTNTGTTVTIASSEIGVTYYLRDNTNDTIVDGPIAGTGSGLTFNTGVLPNTTTYNVYAKNEGNALDFDGVDDYITANNLLTVSNNFTYEFWAKPTGTIVLNSEATSGITGSTGQKYAVYPHHGGTAYGSPNDAGVGVSVGTNGVSVYEHSSSYLPALLVYPTSITSWTHISIVCTNKQYTLYINGVLVKTGQTSLKANVHPNIGELASSQNSGIGGGDYGYYQGSMDDFRLWDYPRTPTQIQSSMLNCNNGSESGLVAEYDFEDGTGSAIASDKSNNNYNSTLTNMDVTTDWIAGLGACNCTSVMSLTPTVTVHDIVAPLADNGTLVDVTAECSVSSLTDPTATDNCSGVITGTTTTTFPITTQGTTVVTWTYDDGNGNTSTQTQNVIVNDVTAPVADNATLSDLTATCEVTSLTDPTATDNCSATVTVTNDATLPITTQGTTVVTWTYDDGNGNTSTQTQNVVITDVTAPVADNGTLVDVTATCEVTSLTDPTATDNCSGTVTVTNDATLPINTIGTTLVTWTYDDGNGNTSTQTQNVIVSSPSIDVTTTTTDLTITANNTTATAYQWLDCNNNNMPITGETNANYTATVNGDYAVIVTEGSCSDTSNCVAITTVGVNELTDLGVSIYPNPNNGTFTISTTANNVFITVYSVDGKTIINHLPITQTNQTINLEGVESGVYFVNVINNTNQKTIRLVVE